MKLVAPISKVEKVFLIIETEANELYLGTLSLERNKKYTNMSLLKINYNKRLKGKAYILTEKKKNVFTNR